MPEVLRRRDETPSWVTSLLSEIDTLQFGPEFERFLPDADLMFGAMHAKGVAAIRKLFIRLTGELTTKHRVHEFWSGSYTNVLRGDVELARRNDESHIIVVPTAQFFIMGGQRSTRIARLSIIVGPIGFDMR